MSLEVLVDSVVSFPATLCVHFNLVTDACTSEDSFVGSVNSDYVMLSCCDVISSNFFETSCLKFRFSSLNWLTSNKTVSSTVSIFFIIRINWSLSTVVDGFTWLFSFFWLSWTYSFCQCLNHLCCLKQMCLCRPELILPWCGMKVFLSFISILLQVIWFLGYDNNFWLWSCCCFIICKCFICSLMVTHFSISTNYSQFICFLITCDQTWCQLLTLESN